MALIIGQGLLADMTTYKSIAFLYDLLHQRYTLSLILTALSRSFEKSLIITS